MTDAQAPPCCRHCGTSFEDMDAFTSHSCADQARKRAVMGLIDNRAEVYPNE